MSIKRCYVENERLSIDFENEVRSVFIKEREGNGMFEMYDRKVRDL